MANADGDAGGEQQPSRAYHALSQMLTAERLGSYLRWSGGDLPAAFALYEWNMTASAAVMHTTGMVEVVVRNAMDRAALIGAVFWVLMSCRCAGPLRWALELGLTGARGGRSIRVGGRP